MTLEKLHLVQAIQRQRREWANLVDFDDRLELAYEQAMSDYEQELDGRTDAFVLRSTLDEVTVPVTGDEVLETTVADVVLVSLVTSARKIFGDSIFIYNEGTGALEVAPRTAFDDIDPLTTTVAFEELNGKIQIYIVQDGVAVPAELQYRYHRKLSTSLAADDTDLDILNATDFLFVVTRTIEYMAAGLVL